MSWTALVFSRCPIITTNGKAVGPPLPVSIVNPRSTGNHSSSLGTKVAHHDMQQSWTTSAPLKMLDCQATISGKRRAGFFLMFLCFLFVFFLAAYHQFLLRLHLQLNIRASFVFYSRVWFARTGCVEVKRGLRSVLILWQIGLVGEHFLILNQSTDKSFDVRKRCALSLVRLLSAERLKWWFCCNLVKIYRFVKHIECLICQIREWFKVKTKVMVLENVRVLIAALFYPVKLYLWLWCCSFLISY